LFKAFKVTGIRSSNESKI